MHVGLDRHRLQVAARVPEADAAVGDVELAADFAEHIEERHHLRLRRALHEHVAVCGERGRRPRRRLNAVGESRVSVALQLLHALDAERAVHVHRDDRAHLLQHGHQVHDLRFGRRAGQLGLAICEHGGEQSLLGRAHRRVRQVDLRAVQTVRRGDVNAVLVFLVNGGAEFAQCLQMEVDRPAANVAAAERRDERLAQPVQQRAREQDRNARRAGERVYIGHVGQLHVLRVDRHNALVAVHVHVHAVQTQQIRNHMHVSYFGHVFEHRRPRREQSRHHGLAYEVLRTAHLDRAVERLAAHHMQYVVSFLHVHLFQALSSTRFEIPKCFQQFPRAFYFGTASVPPASAIPHHSATHHVVLHMGRFPRAHHSRNPAPPPAPHTYHLR